MIPDCVPEVMRRLGILSLEIQRMPKSAGELFADPSRYPYLSVCTTSTHDMNPLRAWWEEDRALTERFYRDVLGMEGDAPDVCTPQICRRILEQHLSSPAMLAVFLRRIRRCVLRIRTANGLTCRRIPAIIGGTGCRCRSRNFWRRPISTPVSGRCSNVPEEPEIHFLRSISENIRLRRRSGVRQYSSRNSYPLPAAAR